MGLGVPAESIPYSEIKHIIRKCPEKRTRALMAFQYAMGNRAGELAYEYNHKEQKLKKGDEPKHKRLVLKREYVSEGIRRRNFTLNKQGLEWTSPNFKNKNQKKKQAWVFKNEEWLFRIMLKWLKYRKGKRYLFDIKTSRIKQLIDAELKRYNKDYASHWLRHSRATHIAQITRDIFTVKEFLGHADIRTSAKYVSIAKERIKARLGKKSFEEVLGERV